MTAPNYVVRRHYLLDDPPKPKRAKRIAAPKPVVTKPRASVAGASPTREVVRFVRSETRPKPRSKAVVWNAAILTAAKLIRESGNPSLAKHVRLLVKPTKGDLA